MSKRGQPIECPVCKRNWLRVSLHPTEDVYLATCQRCDRTYLLEGGELIFDARRIPTWVFGEGGGK